jgi:hypothetical protein
VAEDVYIKFGHYEIDSARMQEYVRQQEMNQAEVKRIVKARLMHLDWMHRHFAYEVLEPPEGME